MPHDRKNYNKMQCLILTPILGPPQPPSDAPDLAYTMSAEPPTPAQPDSVTFRANGGIDT
jgi:hypothetical protein